MTLQKQPPRRFFKISVLFFQEQPFYNIPGGGVYCSSKRHVFSGRVCIFFEQTRIFQEGLSNRHVFSRRVYMFFEQTQIFQEGLSNRHVFSRRVYMFFEQTQIFVEGLSNRQCLLSTINLSIQAIHFLIFSLFSQSINIIFQQSIYPSHTTFVSLSQISLCLFQQHTSNTRECPCIYLFIHPNHTTFVSFRFH